MIYDNIDVNIIQIFLDNSRRIKVDNLKQIRNIDKLGDDRELTCWKIAKLLRWDDEDKCFNVKRFYDCKSKLVADRLESMAKEGIVFISRNGGGVRSYNLIQNRADIRKHKFPDGYHKSLIIKENQRWIVIQI